MIVDFSEQRPKSKRTSASCSHLLISNFKRTPGVAKFRSYTYATFVLPNPASSLIIQSHSLLKTLAPLIPIKTHVSIHVQKKIRSYSYLDISKVNIDQSRHCTGSPPSPWVSKDTQPVQNIRHLHSGQAIDRRSFWSPCFSSNSAVIRYCCFVLLLLQNQVLQLRFLGLNIISSVSSFYQLSHFLKFASLKVLIKLLCMLDGGGDVDGSSIKFEWNRGNLEKFQ